MAPVGPRRSAVGSAPPAAVVTPAVPVDERWAATEKLLAAGLVFAVAVRIYLFSALTPGIGLAVVLAPLLLAVLPRFRLAVPLFVLAGVALAGGVGLSVLAPDAYRIDAGNQLYSITFFAGIFISIAALLWARTKLEPATIAIIFGLGSMISAAFGDGLGSGNPWKFALAVPVAMLLLGVASATRSRIVELVVLIMLAGVSVIFDSRSYMATFLLAGVLVVWQLKPRKLSQRGTVARTAILLVAAGAAVYLLGTELLVGGVLGTEAQQRTLSQLDTAGNLILGGRPELGAFLALLAYRPIGFGFGAVLDLAGVNAAKAGMTATGYDAENGYVERFMFGSGIELHSVTGDLWAQAGLPGIALAIMIAVIVIIGVVRHVAHGTATALHLFLTCWTGWNLLFSPLISATPTLILLLALTLTPKDPPPTGHQSSDSAGVSLRN